MARPQPTTLPITESFSGAGVNLIKGVSEHYFPYKYKDVSCIISEAKVDIRNFRQMDVSFKFSLDIDMPTVENLYEDENWKTMRTGFVAQNNGNPSGFFAPAPLMALMLNKYLQVVEAELIINGDKAPLMIDNNSDLLILPTSYTPLVDLPKGESYLFYDKKSSVFYGNIYPGQDYYLKIKLEANAATFEFAALFPYKEVTYSGIDLRSSGEYKVESLAVIVKPETGREFPEWYRTRLQRLTDRDSGRLQERAALPTRGFYPLFRPETYLSKVPDSVEMLSKLIEDAAIDVRRPVKVETNEALRLDFMLSVPEDKKTDIIVRTIQRPLPTRIYEQIQRLPKYQEVLVEYDIINLSKERVKIRVETEIPGYAVKESKSFLIHQQNNNAGQKARQIINQCPRLERGVLESISTPERATMICRVKDEDTNAILFEESYPLDLLPHDQMVWELADVRSNNSFNLRDFICAWVNPTDSEGLLDKVRSAAADYHDDRAFGHETSTIGDIEKHVKAIYQYLASSGMKYVNQPFTSRDVEASQRVVLPTSCIKNSAGNCIDLSVLFASILEGVGISTQIFLTTDHAFIGWGDIQRPNQMVFLETTMIGSATFEAATEQGRKNYEEAYTFSGSNGHMIFPPQLMLQMRGNYIVDVFEVRNSGLVSSRI